MQGPYTKITFINTLEMTKMATLLLTDITNNLLHPNGHYTASYVNLL